MDGKLGGEWATAAIMVAARKCEHRVQGTQAVRKTLALAIGLSESAGLGSPDASLLYVSLCVQPAHGVLARDLSVHDPTGKCV